MWSLFQALLEQLLRSGTTMRRLSSEHAVKMQNKGLHPVRVCECVCVCLSVSVCLVVTLEGVQVGFEAQGAGVGEVGRPVKVQAC